MGVSWASADIAADTLRGKYPQVEMKLFTTFLNNDARDELLEICPQSGFSEIWIADPTEVEAYGSVELFGLLPIEFWAATRIILAASHTDKPLVYTISQQAY